MCMKKTGSFTLIYLMLFLMLGWFFLSFTKSVTTVELKYSDFLTAVEKEEIKSVKIEGEMIKGQIVKGDNKGKQFSTIAPYDPDLIKILREKKLDILAVSTAPSFWSGLLMSFLPMIFLVVIWVYFMRKIQGGGAGGAMNFGKSTAKLLTGNNQRVTFQDVAGIDEAKEDLQEIIGFLKNPKKFTKLGGRIPKGVLLVGAPGTGKTLLARAIAGEAGVPFFNISGSDFVEMFVGVGAARVRDLFAQGLKNAPCIIFIDEIDAVGRHRGAGLGGGHDEREQTLNQLLVEMDGFAANEGVIIVAATNRPDVLDPALLRPGRFDRRVVVSRPDVKGRKAILEVHVRKIPMSDDVDLLKIAQGTPGFVGADLENMANEAALLAARKDKEKVSMHDFEMAKDKVMMGAERKSMVMSAKEKNNTAYHEAGHALVATLLPGTDPVHKVTIIPRGMALGLTQQLPEEDKHSYSKSYLLNTLVILYGGRVAEELIAPDDFTTGASNDIEKASELVRRMVTEWGMSGMGAMSFGRKEQEIFLGRDFTQTKDYSEDTAIQIDKEIKKLTTESHERARVLLKNNITVLHAIAAELLEKETLDGPDLERIINNFKNPSA